MQPLSGNESSGGNAPVNSPTADDDKILTLGHLSRGIAHDFKNLVTAIQGNAELALRELGRSEERARRALMLIFSATRQSQELIDQILAFSRDERLPYKPLNLVNIVRDTQALLEVKAPESIRMDFQLPDTVVAVHANSSQMHQVMMNLCTNAVQAMMAKGGTLCVKLNSKDGWALLEVIDNGMGIPEELREKIFDPFFTTKSLGLGNGLGLAVVHSIVSACGGDISFCQNEGGGTRFLVRLPLTEEAPQEDRRLNFGDSIHFEQKLAVLLVDDEEFMRRLGMDMLHSLGYRVSLASDGREALEMVKRKPDYFDVVLSDLRMPEMNGWQLAGEIQKLRPQLPFILVTAFNDADSDENLKDLGIREVVQKPFLVEHVHKAINRAVAK